MKYEIRCKTEDNTYILVAKIDQRLAAEIFYRFDGGWRKFNGKRAYCIEEDAVFKGPRIDVMLWKGYLIIECDD